MDKWSPIPTTLYNHELGILYCPIAKNGCSSLKALMIELSGYESTGAVHKELDSGDIPLQLKHYPKDIRRHALSSDEVFRFAVIREPVERVISAYIEKFILHRMQKYQWRHTRPVVAKVQGVDECDANMNYGITFSEFVNYILNTDDEMLDTHWMPQVNYLRGIRYSKLYALESLDDLKIELFKIAGRQTEIPHRNKSKKGTGFHRSTELLINARPKSIQDKMLTKDNFLDPDLVAALQMKFSVDYAIYDNLRK